MQARIAEGCENEEKVGEKASIRVKRWWRAEESQRGIALKEAKARRVGGLLWARRWAAVRIKRPESMPVLVRSHRQRSGCW